MMISADDEIQLDDGQIPNDREKDQSKLNDSFGIAKTIQKPLNFPNFQTPAAMQNPLMSTFQPDNINFFNITAAPVPVFDATKSLATNTIRAQSEPPQTSPKSVTLSPTIQNTSLIKIKNGSPILPDKQIDLRTPPNVPQLVPLTSAVPTNHNIQATLKPQQEKVQILQPPPSIPLMPSANLAQNTQMTPTQFTSVLPPPITTPLSKQNTPVNPYSAKGALNKKIYEPVVQSVPLAPANVSIGTLPNASPIPTNIYVPPSIPAPGLGQDTNQVLDDSEPISALNYFETNQRPTATPDMQRNLTPSFSLEPKMSMNSEYLDNQQRSHTPQRNVWNRFVSSLKTGVESVLTTIDPQMKDYMHSMNEHLHILNSSGDHTLSDAIKLAFNQLGFLRLTIFDYDSKTHNEYAPQIVGYPCVVHHLNEKIVNSEQYIQQKCMIICLQSFIVELYQDSWFDQTCIMLKDTMHNIDITVFTEAIPVPIELINHLKQSQSDNYPLKWSGFSMDLRENNVNWYETVFGMQQKTLIANSLKTLAAIFKNKFINNISGKSLS